MSNKDLERYDAISYSKISEAQYDMAKWGYIKHAIWFNIWKLINAIQCNKWLWKVKDYYNYL